jgi:hypothetical protein
MTTTSPSTSKIFDGWSGWTVWGPIKGSKLRRDSPDEELAISMGHTHTRGANNEGKCERESRILKASHCLARDGQWRRGRASGSEEPLTELFL